MGRRKATIFFLILGISLVILAITLNVGWILLNLREVVMLVLGIIFFALIITGLTLNTIFLLREIRRNEQHDAFLNSVTHELKTPIASIRLYLDTLKSRDVTPEKQREFYNVMSADADRLLSTVEQVLRASSTKERKLQMSHNEVDIREVLIESAAIVKTRRNLDEQAIGFADSIEPIRISGDAAELQTAFINLLDNAIKYSNSEPSVTISVARLPANDRIEISVRDNGIGIPQGEIKRIFKRFYRVKNSSISAKGTGLGLFIVKAIIEMHGGKIRAESRGEGLGSTFFVQLPTIK